MKTREEKEAGGQGERKRGRVKRQGRRGEERWMDQKMERERKEEKMDR